MKKQNKLLLKDGMGEYISIFGRRNKMKYIALAIITVADFVFCYRMKQDSYLVLLIPMWWVIIAN